VVTPAQRRTVVTDAQATADLSERCACRYLGIHRALLRYRPHRPDDAGPAGGLAGPGGAQAPVVSSIT